MHGELLDDDAKGPMTFHRLIIACTAEAMQEGERSHCPSLGEEGHHLFGIEWPMQLGRRITTP